MDAPTPRPALQHLSQILGDLARLPQAGPVTVGSIARQLDNRGPAALLAILSLPVVLPIPMPGITAIIGLPMLLLSLQIAARTPHFWLPRALRDRPVAMDRVAPIISRALPRLERLEILLQPRLRPLLHPAMQVLYGLVCAWLSLILFLPIPFGNVLPGCAVFALALALLERDGLMALAGLALAAASTAVTGGTMAALVYGLVLLVQRKLEG